MASNRAAPATTQAAGSTLVGRAIALVRGRKIAASMMFVVAVAVIGVGMALSLIFGASPPRGNPSPPGDHRAACTTRLDRQEWANLPGWLRTL